MGEVADGVRRQLLRLGRYAHLEEHVAAVVQVAAEGAGRDARLPRQPALTDKLQSVVSVHCRCFLVFMDGLCRVLLSRRLRILLTVLEVTSHGLHEYSSPNSALCILSLRVWR